MSYRVVVDSPQRIRALASSAKISVVDAKLEKTQAVITRTSYSASASAQILNAFADYAKLTTQTQYRTLTAIDVALDPYSLNKYFRLEEFSVSDLVSVNTGKAPNEVLGASDQVENFRLGKGIGDEMGIGDFTHILLEIQRAFSDTLSYSDTHALGLGLKKSDSIGAYDAAQRNLGKGLADSFAIAEATAFSLTSLLSDGTSLSEQFNRTVSFIRGFTETAGISEVTATSVSKALQDGASVADLFARTVSYDRGFIESFGTADTESLLVDKGVADTAALSEELSRTVSFQRSFSDAFVLDDFTDVDAIRRSASAVKNNVFGFTDTQTFGTEKTLQDTAAFSDLAALATGRPASDAFSVGDIFHKVTTFSRPFSDTTSLSESSSSSISKVLSDPASVSDIFQKDVAFTRTFSDAVSFAEQSVAAFSKGLADTASLTESIEITTASLASSVLNAGALNSSPLNN